MSNNFCLLDSKKFNENLQAVNLGKTLQNTILIDSNNNLLQNNTVNEQANNIQYINKKNQNIINPQINNNQDIQKCYLNNSNNNQDIQKCYLNNSLYAIYNNGNEKIKYIKDEKNNDIYDIDMNNETEFSFQEKLKEIKMENNSIPDKNLNNIIPDKNLNNIIPDKNLNNIIPDNNLNNIIPDNNLNNFMDNHFQSQTTNCNLTILGNNGSQTTNINPGNTSLNLKEVYSKTDVGNPFNRPNLSINNQKNILTEKSRKEENNKLLSELNNMPITESHIEQNVNSNNSNEEFFNNNNPILDIPTVKSNYN